MRDLESYIFLFIIYIVDELKYIQTLSIISLSVYSFLHILKTCNTKCDDYEYQEYF